MWTSNEKSIGDPWEPHSKASKASRFDPQGRLQLSPLLVFNIGLVYTKIFEGKLQSPLETVSGIRWGEFVGSPDSQFGNLNITLNELSCDIGHIAHVVAFSDGICFAFPSNTCLVYKVQIIIVTLPSKIFTIY